MIYKVFECITLLSNKLFVVHLKFKGKISWI